MTTHEKLSVVAPADWVSGPGQGRWTYKEYATIPDDGHRYEVVNGVLYMAPSPSWYHQSIVLEMGAYLKDFVKSAGLGRVCVAPFDVELNYGNIVQPDVFVVLNNHLDRITMNRLIGAPDLVVEVASPSTSGHDRREKQDAYAAAGVPEYWIVNPDARTVEILQLVQRVYRSLGLFIGDDTVTSQVVPQFPIRVEQFFVDE